MRNPDPLSQHVVEQNILELAGELSDVTSRLYDAAQRAANARHAYRVAYAKGILGAPKGATVPEREASAQLVSADELLEREVATALEDSLKVAASNLRAQLGGMQSLGANIRAAIDHSAGRGS